MSHWVKAILEDACSQHHQMPEHVRKGVNRIIEIVEASTEFQFRSKGSEKVADELAICDNLVEMSQLLWNAATESGFQNFALFVMSQGDGHAFPSRYCTSMSKDWMARYRARSYQYVDPILHWAKNGDGMFLFSDAKSNAPMVKSFWDDADKYGVGRNGICYATTRPNGARLGVSYFTEDTAEHTRESCRVNGYDLKVISQLAIECFCYLSAGEKLESNVLSLEELRFLHLLATSDYPENAMGLSGVFGGNKALQISIRKKLNVQTVFQAVSIASAKRWFDSLPYYDEEIVSPFVELSGWNVAEADSEETPRLQDI